MSNSILIRRISGTGQGKEENHETQEISFGTGPHNTVRYDPTWDRGVAPAHARVWRDESGAWWLQDAGSSTGTFVNGQRVTMKRRVGGPTVIELGQNGPKVEMVLPAVQEGAAHAPARAGAPSSGGGAGKWLAISAAVVLMLGGGTWFYLGGAATGGSAPISEAGGAIKMEWTPQVDMGGQIFPSFLIAIATMDQSKLPNAKAKNRLGDPGGIICVKMVSPKDNAKVKVQVEANTMMSGGSIQVELPKKGETYRIYPKVDFRYEALLKVRQALPLTLTAKISTDGVEESKAVTIRVSSINDCPFAVRSIDTPASRNLAGCMWMFAAYVNENHPFSEEIRKEALSSGIISKFNGYSSGEAGVVRQVFAIWNVLQQRGVRYSNVTTVSGNDADVFAQQVRFVDQTMTSSQANCADGSVIFASILRQIGIEPALVVVPGHMFVGFYLKEGDPDSLTFLETTVIGATDLSRVPGFEEIPPSVRLEVLSIIEEKKSAAVTASSVSFRKAIECGCFEFYQKHKEALEKGLQGSGVIGIQTARRSGIMPIAYQP